MAMIRIEWAQLCEMAFLDNCNRLCMIGIMTRFPTPELPISMRQLMMVVRVADAQPDESFSVGISMITPHGTALTPQRADGFEISGTPEYIFITLRDIPLAEEGMHRFVITVGQGVPTSIYVPVRLATNQSNANGNENHGAVGALSQSSWMRPRQVN